MTKFKLSLSLLVTRVSTANNVKITLSANGFTLWTDFLNRCFNFHVFLLLNSLNDSALASIRLKLNHHFVSNENTNSMQSHFSS